MRKMLGVWMEVGEFVVVTAVGDSLMIAVDAVVGRVTVVVLVVGLE